MTDKQTTPSQRDRPPEQVQSVFSEVLCAVDGTRASLAAVRQAAELAGEGGHLTLLAVTSQSGSGAYRTAAIGPARAQRIIERAGQIARKAGVRSTGVVDPGGPPPQVILDRAPQHDLLAMGAPVSSWLAGIFFESAAFAALRALTVPLLLARPMPDPGAFARRILVASDGLNGSDRLVELAGRLGGGRGARTILVHALGAESQARPHRIEAQAATLKRAVPRDSVLLVEPGDARRLILEVAEREQVSLIVMGSRRFDGRSALGSVSRRIAREAPCSVLVVAPETPAGG